MSPTLSNAAIRDVRGYLYVAASSIALAAILIRSDGSLFAGGAFVAALVVASLTFYRIDWGFFVFILMVFFFDQFPYGPTFTGNVQYFTNLSTITYLPRMSQASVSPMELHLVFVILVWIVSGVLRRDLHLVQIDLRFAVGGFLGALLSSLAYGLARGGDPTISLWEIRGLFYIVIMFLFVPQVIRTKVQLETLIWICIAGISFKALQGAARFALLGFSFGPYETLTNHEDPVFIVTIFFLYFGLVLFGGSEKQRKAVRWLLPLLCLGFVAGQRRAAYASLLMTLPAFILLIPRDARRKFVRGLTYFAVIFGAYVVVFWNSGPENRIAAPALQLRATLTGEGGVRGAHDVTSTQYRLLENYNLAMTLKRSPFLGLGFGNPYDTPLAMWRTGMNKLLLYIPHNNILWIIVKMGALGAFAFWLFFDAIIFHGATRFRMLTDPYLKSVCAVCVVAVINQFVVSFVDLQLGWARNAVYLGMLTGLIAALRHIDSQSVSPLTERNTGV